MQYDKKTGKIAPEQLRMASKYIKYLSKYKQDKQAGIRFIKNNIDTFKKDIIIMNQWYNIYMYLEKNGHNRARGIIEIIKVIAEQVNYSNKTNRFNIKNPDEIEISSDNIKLITKLIWEMKKIKETLREEDETELNVLSQKLDTLKEYIYTELKRKGLMVNNNKIEGR